MRRGWIFGCLGAAVVVFVLLSIGFYFLVWRPAQNFLAGLGDTNLLAVPPAQEAPLNPPAEGQITEVTEVTLTRDDVRKFVRIRRDVRAAVGEDFAALQNLYADFSAGQAPGVVEILNAVRSVGGVVERARVAQQAGLEREDLTEEEYAAIRATVNQALGTPQVDLQAAAQSLQNLQVPEVTRVLPPADDEASQLVAPFREELLFTAPLTLLGL